MKNLLDISASLETHLNRAIFVVNKHADNTFKATMIIALTQSVVRVDGLNVDLVELQEEVVDIADIINDLRNDALDILMVHRDFAEQIAKDLRVLNTNVSKPTIIEKDKK